MQTLYTVQGNTSPNLKLTLHREGAPIVVTGATVNLILKDSAGTVVNTGHQACTITDGAKGKVTYLVQVGDFSASGEYTGEVQVTFPGGAFEEIHETFVIEARA